MAATSTRMLRLLSLLQHRSEWAGPALAERLEISPRTLRRDVDRLRGLGYPVEARRGVDGGYRLAAGATLPPLVLDDEEAVALTVGLQSAVQSATVAGMAESSLRALAKVTQVLPVRLKQRVESLRAMTLPATWGSEAPVVDSEMLLSVAQACRDGIRLRFAYAAPRRDPVDRHVEPHRLVLLGRRWYLVAYDLDRSDWRSFRLDRLSTPHPTGERAHPRPFPAEDAAAFVRSGIERIPAPYRVEAVVAAPASVVRERIGRRAAVTELGEERCLVVMTSDTLAWPAMALGVTGAEFEVLGPAELIGYLGEWSGRFARATGG